MGKCNISAKCGGCECLDLKYEEQLKQKDEYIKKLFGNKKIKINKIIGMEDPTNYRNKGKYVFGFDVKRSPTMGFFEKGTHNVLYSADCLIQNRKINEIAEYIFGLVKKYGLKIYNEDTKKGFMRHLVIRYGIYTDEVMIIFVTVDGKMYKRKEITEELLQKFPNIKTIVQNINEKDTNAILGNKIIKLYGNGYIIDYLNGIKFKISPLSFYQVNSIQAEKLYSKAIECANLDKKEIVYDLYCGIGTISLIVSKKVFKVYGIEIVKDAVDDAIENAKLNNIRNAIFAAGKVEDTLLKLYSRTGRADTIIVDPPRTGLDEKTIEIINRIMPEKLVYISCNPVTLIRDLKDFEGRYEIKEVQPVDMFPYTMHVETVVLMTRKETL